MIDRIPARREKAREEQRRAKRVREREREREREKRGTWKAKGGEERSFFHPDARKLFLPVPRGRVGGGGVGGGDPRARTKT